MNKNNKSGYTGVYFDSVNDRWRAQIGFQGKKIKLGTFSKKEDAIEARSKAEEFYKVPKYKELLKGEVVGYVIPTFIADKILKIREKDPFYHPTVEKLKELLLETFLKFDGSCSFFVFATRYLTKRIGESSVIKEFGFTNTSFTDHIQSSAFYMQAKNFMVDQPALTATLCLDQKDEVNKESTKLTEAVVYFFLNGLTYYQIGQIFFISEAKIGRIIAKMRKSYENC